MIRCWRLDCGRQTMVLGAKNNRLAEVAYWGAPLPDDENLQTLYAAYQIDLTGGMLDTNPDLSICPEESRTFPGHPGLELRATDGRRLRPAFALQSVEQSHGSLSLIYRDSAIGLSYTARFLVHQNTHIIEARAAITSETPVFLDWLAAPVLPASQQSDSFLDFAGRWCGEFQTARTRWKAGRHCRENKTGRTSHEHFPGLIIPDRSATNTQGQVYAFHYGWSGGHKMIAEELPDGRRQIQFGHAGGIEKAAKTEFISAPLFATYAGTGINGCATSFQRHLRTEIIRWPDKTRPRPVHYNCWEAVYFDHEIAALKDIATRAARLGAERFVLDDGWFTNRNDDTRALADWRVDKTKFPDGLTPLINHVQSQGMTFGLWFEPEMINANSHTFRAHPEWVLGHKNQILGRGQYALDMANPQLQAYLFDQISDILAVYDIDYIKWDHNRVLPFADAAQTEGTYALLDRIRGAFPKVEIESCASGGGRIDFEILERTHRVWLSDSNDALERLNIQHNAALFLPAAVTGSHVGPRSCHTSGRTLDIRFRAWVAAQRHFGFEMDPRELTAEEEDILRQITAWWKANRDWMMQADILRLDSPDPAVIAEQQHAQNGARFVVFAGKAATSRQISPRPLRLTGLDEKATYRVDLLNRADIGPLSRGSPLLKNAALTASGAYLMHHGLTLPWSFPETMWVLEGTRL